MSHSLNDIGSVRKFRKSFSVGKTNPRTIVEQLLEAAKLER